MALDSRGADSSPQGIRALAPGRVDVPRSPGVLPPRARSHRYPFSVGEEAREIAFTQHAYRAIRNAAYKVAARRGHRFRVTWDRREHVEIRRMR